MMRGLILAAAMSAGWGGCLAGTLGTITIIEGNALIYRDAGRLLAGEGVRLEPGDIVQTDESTLMQVEMPDRTVLQFGPKTRAMLEAGGGRFKTPPWVYLMDGWCKVSGLNSGTDAQSGIDFRSRLLDIPAGRGVMVVRSSASDTSLFVERGALRVQERQPHGKSQVVSLNAGAYYRRMGHERGEVNGPGIESSFLAALPRAFRDSLPQRLDRYRDADITPAAGPDFTYADVQDWLNGEYWLRRPLVSRWRAKARNPAFRAGLIAQLHSHWEWDRILFPEKYLPKPVASAASAAAMPGRAASVVVFPTKR